MAVLLAIAAPAAEELWAPGPVRVSRIYRFDVLELARAGETRPFRVRGLQPLHREDRIRLQAATRAARRWAARADLVLVDPAHNARGELTGHLRASTGELLSEHLLRSGLALFDPIGLPQEVRDRLARAQSDARANRAGLWADPPVASERVRVAHERVVTVCGHASGIHPDGHGGFEIRLGPVFPRHHLSAWIPKEVSDAFDSPERTFLRHDVCITGRLARHTARPRLRVLDPTQIEDRGGFRAR